MGVSKGIRSILFAGAAMVALVSTPAFGQATPTTLTVTVAPISGGVLIGSNNNYTVTITNTGGAEATGLQITGADLPPELELANVVAVPASTPPNPVPTTGCNAPNTALPCTLTNGTLAPGASVRVRFAAAGVIPPNPTCPAVDGSPIGDTTIRAKAANSEEASGTAANVLNQYADLQAEMTGPASVASGSTHTITTTVTNAGPCAIPDPDPAADAVGDTVVATFSWPASYTLLSTTATCIFAPPAAGEPAPTQLDLVAGDCELGPMAVGATTSFDTVVQVPSVNDDLVRSVYFSGVEVAAAEMQEGSPDDNVAEVESRYDRGDDAGCSSGGAGAILSLLPLLAAAARRRRKSA